MNPSYLHMNPFLETTEAGNMQRIAESFDSFGTYADEATSEGLGESLPQRFDVGLNYVTHGLDGSGNADEEATAAARTNYFRETYAYGDEVKASGIEPFMEHRLMRATALSMSGCQEVVPAIVYANLLVPGQELAIHTDVPEFRGANRKNTPQWLLVCMLHSGLFDGWRIPILTCVSWFGAAAGGAFTFYPHGPFGKRESIPAQHNSAILLDTDRFFHGVERVGSQTPDLPAIGPDTRLHFLGDDCWQMRSAEVEPVDFQWADIRYSISWKAYCFSDAAERSTWETGSDDLSIDEILDTLELELRSRGVMQGARPEPNTFALMLVQTLIQYPGSNSTFSD